MILCASLYAPGRLLVSGTVLDSVMQHFLPKQKIMLDLVSSPGGFSPSQAGWWLGRVGAWLVVISVLVLVNCGVRRGCGVAAMSQCEGLCAVCEFCVGAAVGVCGLATGRLAAQYAASTVMSRFFL